MFEPEHSHEDRDTPVYKSWKEQADARIAATEIIWQAVRAAKSRVVVKSVQERAHEEVSQVATISESNTMRTEVEILPSEMRQLHKIKHNTEELLENANIVEQPDPPAELTNPKEQPEQSPDDRDPPVHRQHESQEEKVVPVATDTELVKTQPIEEYLGELVQTQPSQEYLGEKVHTIVATHVVPKKRAHEEVCLMATVTEFDKTRVEKCSRVVPGPLVENDVVANMMESAKVSVGPGQLIHTEASKMAVNRVDREGKYSVSTDEQTDITENLQLESTAMYMVPGRDCDEVMGTDIRVDQFHMEVSQAATIKYLSPIMSVSGPRN
jgi:vacuolar-type H+-ATPase subunit I/STV1